MEELEVYSKMSAIADEDQLSLQFGASNQQNQRVMEHKSWLPLWRRPMPTA